MRAKTRVALFDHPWEKCAKKHNGHEPMPHARSRLLHIAGTFGATSWESSKSGQAPRPPALPISKALARKAAKMVGSARNPSGRRQRIPRSRHTRFAGGMKVGAEVDEPPAATPHLNASHGGSSTPSPRGTFDVSGDVGWHGHQKHRAPQSLHEVCASLATTSGRRPR